jgi:hypothetical protein
MDMVVDADTDKHVMLSAANKKYGILNRTLSYRLGSRTVICCCMKGIDT